MNKEENIIPQEQNKEQDTIIQEENKKQSVKFYIILLLCGIGGGIGGVTMLYLNTGIENTSNFIMNFVNKDAYVFSMVLSVIMVVLTLATALLIHKNITKSKINAKVFMEKDYYDGLEQLERKQSLNLWITNILCILHFFFFSITIFMSKRFEGQHNQVFIMTLTVTAVLLGGTLVVIKIQQQIVDLLRIMNPEKKGSIYDFKFNKKWEASCDEAELMKIYRGGYKAYSAVKNFSIILWGVFMFIGIGTGSGFLPAIVILVIWTVNTCVFSYYTI